jgi:hypothetical protein
MPLVRAWARGLSGASGTAVLVPGGVFAALLLLALAGSFGRLGGLGQAFSGPAAPQSPAGAGVLGAQPSHRAALLPVVGARTVAAGAAAANAAPAAGLLSTGGHPAGTTPSTSRSTGGGTPQPGPGSTSVPPAQGCGSACAGRPPPPTVIDGVVAAGTAVTSKLPGGLGTLTTQVLQHVGATLDKVLPTDRSSNAVQQVGATLAKLKLP